MAVTNPIPENTGLLICGHGSRSALVQQEFVALVDALRERLSDANIDYGFLEYAEPGIETALDRLREQGVTQIKAIPALLFAAQHIKSDLPAVFERYRQRRPEMAIDMSDELGLHSDMLAAFQQRILASMGLDALPETGALYDTLLVVVGRGTSDIEANAEVEKLTRLMTETMGFGWSQTVYSGVTFPSVGCGLEMALKLGFKKLVVAPYFLFGGTLIGRVNAYVQHIAQQHTDVQFYQADYLRDHEHVVSAMVARLNDLLGNNKQAYVQGATKPADQNYPHIAHPYGPRTMVNDNVCCCFTKTLPQSVIDEEQSVKSERAGKPQCKR